MTGCWTCCYAAHSSGVSFYLVDDDPGEGPRLHRHPYTETWVVLAGTATITADDETVEAARGDICTHASPRMVQEDLE